MIITNGVVYTMDPQFAITEAIAIDGNRIIAIGTNEVIHKYKSENTIVIDAQGKMILPGLIDGHGHFLGLGNSLRSLDLRGTQSWTEILDSVKARVERTPKGQWINGRGWHQEKWTSTPENNVNGYPLHDELSAISPNHPIVLRHASGHALMANAKAMEICGINAEMGQPDGGEMIMTSDGMLSGVFIENAMERVTDVYKSIQEMRTSEEKLKDLNEIIHLAAHECHKYGITSFCDAGTTVSTIQQLEILSLKTQIPVRLWIMFYDEPQAIDEFMVNRKETNPEFLTVGGIKGYMDGALGSYGAWLLDPYADKPDDFGQNVMTPEKITTYSKIAKKHNIQMCTHAIGDRANREVLDIYERILDGDKNKRWRIEHAQHLTPIDIPRFSQIGVIAAMQPIHCTSDAPFVPKRLGDERAESGAYVWRDLINHGALIGSGTDVPVEPLDPYSNLYAAVTRKSSIEDIPFYPIQSMTRQEALKSLTINNAYAAFQDKEKGSIEAGKLADIIILDRDLMHCSEEEILDTQVLMTILDGKIVYKKE
jgi:predicted amidohydrolase YtcJ